MYERLLALRLAGRITDAQVRAASHREPAPWITPEQAESIIAEAGDHDAVG